MSDSTGPAVRDHARRRQAERHREQRVLVPALVISAVLHLLLLLFVVFHTDFQPARPAPQVVTPAEPVMRAYDIAAVDAEVAAIDVQVREREIQRETAPAERPWAAPQATPVDVDAAGAASAAHDRLEYRMGSREIWRPQAPLPAEEVSPEDRVRARVATELQQYNDSVAAEAAARARALDWTVKDGNGNRWGISEGVLHLGSLRIPVEVPLGDELKARERTWTEIQLQAGSVETRSAFDERVRAIRERKDRERTQNSGGSSTAGPPAGGGTRTTGGGTTGGGSTGG
jgi:hypothetical protein